MVEDLDQGRLYGPSELIKPGQFWSSNQGRAMTLEEVMDWCILRATVEGDRFWVSNFVHFGIGLVPMRGAKGVWILTYRDHGVVKQSKQATDIFEVMVFLAGRY